jgi:hypothetical protein
MVKQNQMTNEEILEKAIEKAKNNGYHPYKYLSLKHETNVLEQLFTSEIANLVIFSHEFAKAFFGECKNPDGGPLCVIHNQDIRDCQVWQYHLQQIALLSEDKRIKYLEKFLDD